MFGITLAVESDCQVRFHAYSVTGNFAITITSSPMEHVAITYKKGST